MTKRRRRSLAVALVTSAIGAAAGLADVSIVPTTSSTGSAITMTSLRVVTSLRNPGTTALTVNMTPSVVDAGCATVSVAPLDGSLTLPYQLAGLQQIQVAVTSSPLALTAACTLDVTGMPGGPHTFDAVFNISPAGSGVVDVQPPIFDMIAPMGLSETQSFVITNYSTDTSSSLSATINPTTPSIGFASGPGCNGQTCNIGVLGAKQSILRTIACTPIGGNANVQIVFAQNGSNFDARDVQCVGSGGGASHLRIDDDPVTIVTAPNTFGSASVNISMLGGMNDDAIAELHLVGGDATFFSFPDLACTPIEQDCVFVTPLAIPYTLSLGCLPDGNVHSTTLVAKGITDSSDTDMATIVCNPNPTGGPILGTNTNTITIAPSPPVGMPSATQTLQLTNIGAQTLSVELSVPLEFVNEWVLMPPCTHAQPCQLVGNNARQDVDIHLQPTTHGARDTVLTITTNEAPPGNVHSVQLVGTAHGAFIEVLDPSTGTFSFGSIPLSAVARHTIQLLNSGNDDVLNGMIDSPIAPFGAATPSISLVAGGTGMFDATCTSATPFDGSGDYAITSAAYNSPTSIHATCKVVDTPITVDPLRFDFEELWIGEPAIEIPFEIANPTNGDIEIAGLAIANAPDVLVLDAPTTDITLHSTDKLTGKVRLLSTTDTVIADDVALEFTADGVALSLPITGRVVTPHAKVDPIALDLGTACVGSPASGMVKLINDGTATIHADFPMMDGSFVTLLGATMYPATLRTNTDIAVEIQPSSTAVGAIHGDLTWPVDASTSPFKVPVDLDYISAGAAVSPQRYDFGVIDVNAASDRRIVTLENCNDAPLQITVAGVVPKTGDADEWDVSPRNEQVVLGAHEKLKLTVRFTPKHRGMHLAAISIIAGNQPANVELIGNALGPPDPTSFYACSCSAPGVPVGGAPIALAFLIAIRRRRR